MRVLHSAALLAPPSGILNQMNWEQDAADQLDIDWDVRMYCPINSAPMNKTIVFDNFFNAKKSVNFFLKIILWVVFRWRYNQWLLSLQDKYDIFLLRYYVHDPFQLWFVFYSKKPVYFVHHTLEVEELALPKNFVSFFRSRFEALIGRLTLPLSKGLICVTQEIINYEKSRAKLNNKPTYLYPNGIKYEFKNQTDLRDKKIPELLFVANFASWHGLDLLLDSMKLSNANFKLHIVGKAPVHLVDSLKIDERIILHGALTHQDIIKLGQRCWIGLSSFALFRKNMKEACPLKVREYLMMGLPVYGDSKDVFPVKSYFYKVGNADMSKILSFAFDARLFKKHKVSTDARKYIEKKKLLSSLYNAIRLGLLNK